MTTSEGRPPPSAAVWRGLGLVAVLLLVGAIATIGLISTGAFDPQPTGELADRRELIPQQIGAGETVLNWLYEADGGAFTLRLTAAWSEGEQDVGYGVAVGAEDDYLVAGVSPLGYAAVWAQRDGRREMVVPWQPWPHVRRGSEANEIQIEAAEGVARVRVNREQLWEGEWALAGAGAGLYAESFGEATAIDFRELATYTPGGTLTPAADSP